jgi:hypothetical protein
MKKIKIEKTKKGYHALWECGGGYTNTGYATVIAGKNGEKKKAIYVRGRGELANSNHALIIIKKGDYIVVAEHHREDFEIQILRVLDFKEEEGETFAITEQAYEFSRGEWDAELPTYLQAAVEAAKEKATCYHCRSPHYILE